MTWWNKRDDDRGEERFPPMPDRSLVFGYMLHSDDKETYTINRKEEFMFGYGDHLTLNRSEAQQVVMSLTQQMLEIDRMKACKEVA